MYRSNYENGVPHDFGEYYWKDGQVYRGEFLNEGDFSNDKKNS